jgi:anhydro-N-acetylmuramic acid kinase
MIYELWQWLLYPNNAGVFSEFTKLANDGLLGKIQNISPEATAITETLAGLGVGGVHNPLLMQWLTELLPCKFRNINDLGFSGDAKEAVLFAILANETLAGGNSQFDLKNGIPSVSMGKISLPT